MYQRPLRRFDFKSTHHLNNAICKEILGEGGFAIVKIYQCKGKEETPDECNKRGPSEKCSEECNKCFVVKQVRPVGRGLWVTQEDIQKREIAIIKILENEFKYGNTLNHPNLIKILDIDIKNKSLLLENYTGIDMLDYLNTNNVDVFFLLRCFSKVLDALEYLHEQGIAHMDVKLENILMNLESREVKLIDFGHSKRFKEEAKPCSYREICGTECYFPPEFYSLCDYYPDKVDIWCCGIVLYNLLYDKMPWERACVYKDNVFNYNKSHFNKGQLWIGTFPYVSRIRMSIYDQKRFQTIFLKVFKTNPQERVNVRELREDFNKLELLNGDNDIFIATIKEYNDNNNTTTDGNATKPDDNNTTTDGNATKLDDTNTTTDVPDDNAEKNDIIIASNAGDNNTKIDENATKPDDNVDKNNT